MAFKRLDHYVATIRPDDAILQGKREEDRRIGKTPSKGQ